MKAIVAAIFFGIAIAGGVLITGQAAKGSVTCEAGEVQWSSQERMAWKSICSEGVADFSKPPFRGGSNALSGAFLHTILFTDAYRDRIPRDGIDIEHARFVDPINLASAKFDYDIVLKDCAFSSLNLQGARIGGNVVLDESTFSSLDAWRARIDQSLYLQGVTAQGDILLGYAEIGSQLLLGPVARITTAKTLELYNAQVVGDVVLDEALLQDIDARQANVGGNFSADGLALRHVEKNVDLLLDLTSAKVVKNVTLKNTRIPKLYMTDAAISGNLEIGGAVVTDRFVMTHAQIGGTLTTGHSSRACSFVSKNGLDFRYLSTDEDLVLTHCRIASSLILTGARIGHELVLTNRAGNYLVWDPGTELILRDVAARSFDDRPRCEKENCSGPWPKIMDLRGFTYQQLGTQIENEQAKGRENMMDRSVAWWKRSWLPLHASNEQLSGNEKYFSPQPYEQLAVVMRGLGYDKESTEILVAGKDEERDEAFSKADYFSGFLLFLHGVLIGYGYYTYRVLYAILAFWAAGVFVLWKTGECDRPEIGNGWTYSFDMLVPLIKLREENYKYELKSVFARRYFYVHKVVGWILASFLVAGVSGLTTK